MSALADIKFFKLMLLEIKTISKLFTIGMTVLSNCQQSAVALFFCCCCVASLRRSFVFLIITLLTAQNSIAQLRRTNGSSGS